MLGQVDAMEILTRVEQYYSNAFNNLAIFFAIGMAVVAIVMTIVGVYIPIVIKRAQERNFEKTLKANLTKAKADAKADAKREIDAATELYKGNLQQAIKQSFQQVNHHSAMHWCDMATTTSETGRWALATRQLCFSINSAIDAGWLPTRPYWKWIINCLGDGSKYVTATHIAQPETRPAILEAVDKLKQQTKTEPYTTILALLEGLLALKKEDK